MIRRNAITGDPVLLAVDRAERPNTFRDAGTCPFCPGHEDETPPEIARIGEPWHLRVFPNKYPATEHHEVVVETRLHDAAFDTLSRDDATDAVTMYATRYAALAPHGTVCVFKNHGAGAGASIAHIHSQVIATPFVPPRITRERDAFARASRCPLCAHVGDVIDETEHFTWLAPDGSSMPYEQWIVPRAHANEMTSLASASELASLLQRASAALRTVDDAFNWIFMNFAGEPAAHWYVQLLSRSTVLAGFELGSGSAIAVIDPADVAKQCRDQRQ